MKRKYEIEFLKAVTLGVKGSRIKVKVFEKKGIFSLWKFKEEFEAECKGFNGWEGYEWYTDKGTRIAWEIEHKAGDLLNKIWRKSKGLKNE